MQIYETWPYLPRIEMEAEDSNAGKKRGPLNDSAYPYLSTAGSFFLGSLFRIFMKAYGIPVRNHAGSHKPSTVWPFNKMSMLCIA